MRLYSSRIAPIIRDIIEALVDGELVEIEPPMVKEVELDVESVLKEYLRAERQLTEEAKDLAHQRGLDYSAHQKIKRQLAEKRRFGLYEESVGYIANQLIETLLHSQHVEEIYGDDKELRAAIAPVLKKHMAQGDALDQEVRKRIKNLQEGTQDWEIRYQQTLERLKQARGES
ncbi:MAG: DUF507 family protein [Myxococcales bacterium]|nr:DUF507 family protein [Myxococcales bacterium]